MVFSRDFPGFSDSKAKVQAMFHQRTIGLCRGWEGHFILDQKKSVVNNYFKKLWMNKTPGRPTDLSEYKKSIMPLLHSIMSSNKTTCRKHSIYLTGIHHQISNFTHHRSHSKSKQAKLQ